METRSSVRKYLGLNDGHQCQGRAWFRSKHAVLGFRKHGKKTGSVINTASVVELVGAATPPLAYAASKGAVLAMTRELGIVHAREGEWNTPEISHRTFANETFE